MPATILVVEDESITATDIQKRLTKMGYDVPHISSTGEEAILMAKSLRPNLVLMDIRLKGSVDGVEAAETIRASYDIPIVFLTAFSDDAILKRARVSEPYGYLLKPFEHAELQMTVGLALNNHSKAAHFKDRGTQLTSTLSSMSDGVICLDASGTVLSMNPAAETLTGWAEGEAQHKSIVKVFITREDMVSTLITEARNDGRPKGSGAPATLLPKSGAPVQVEVSAAVRTLRNGEDHGSVLVIRELTERLIREHDAAVREQRSSVLLRAIPDAMIRLDRAGMVLDIQSPGVTGRAKDAAVGCSLYDSGMPRVIVDQIITAARWALERNEPRILEFALPASGGLCRKWAQIVPTGRDEVVMVMRDITAARSSDTLRQIGIDDLMEKEMEGFAESVGEALLGPSLTTSGVCDRFIKRFNSHLPPEGRASIRTIRDSAVATGLIVENITFLLGLKTRQVHKTLVRMTETAQESVNEVSRKHGYREMNVSFGNLPDCFASQLLIRQVLINLLDNAFKFAKPDTDARIEVGSYRAADDTCYFVRDNGVGFDDRFANRVFGPFQRLHRPERYAGVGLGLAIAQRIIDRHGGRIWAESTVGNGATFSFSLPSI